MKASMIKGYSLNLYYGTFSYSGSRGVDTQVECCQLGFLAILFS